MRQCAVLLALVAVTAVAAPAGAEVFRFVGPDGTVHFTNAPTDPRYRREGLVTRAAISVVTPAYAAPLYAREIDRAAERYGVPETLIRAVIRVESGFNPRAVSRRGARGLMQLMPETAAFLGVRDAFDPRENIEAGVRHLRGLMERFEHDVPLALAAYNAGEQAVLAFRGIPPYPETREYVSRVLRLYSGSPIVVPREAFRTISADGTVVYTNIPHRRRLF